MYQIEKPDSAAGQVSLQIQHQPFLRNNEYFHDLLTGYTLFGSHTNLQIGYQPNAHFKIQGGVYLRKDYGNEGLYRVVPLMTAKYERNGFSLIAGNLESNFSHRCIEPLLNYERFITHYHEQGLQIKFNKKHVWSDTWINWEKMQYIQSPFQEQFTIGESAQWIIKQDPHKKIFIPVQVMLSHQGGQIDTVNLPSRSKMNAAVGFMYKKKTNGIISEWNMQHYVLWYQELAAAASTPIKSGYAFYANTEIKSTYNVHANLSYWYGNSFLSARGGDLFQSVSSPYTLTQVARIQKIRSLVIARLLYQQEIYPGFSLDIRFEPYYDCAGQFFEYAYAIFINYKKDFNLFNEISRRKN